MQTHTGTHTRIHAHSQAHACAHIAQASDASGAGCCHALPRAHMYRQARIATPHMHAHACERIRGHMQQAWRCIQEAVNKWFLVPLFSWQLPPETVGNAPSKQSMSAVNTTSHAHLSKQRGWMSHALATRITDFTLNLAALARRLLGKSPKKNKEAEEET